MKVNLFFKLCFGLPVLLLADYLLMVLLGCASCLFGFGDSYFCGPYCIAGKVLLALSGILFLWYILPDIKKLFLQKNKGSV
jgi:hypothetical protein